MGVPGVHDAPEWVFTFAGMRSSKLRDFLMSFPNKFTRFDESILAKISYLMLDEIDSISLNDLIEKRKDKFEDISQLVLALDVLYALGKIDIGENQGMIRYVN